MKLFFSTLLLLLSLSVFSGSAFALSSPNIPLDSPVYLYLEKLAGFGLIKRDIKGIRPYSKSEGARLLKEAEDALSSGGYPVLATELVARLKELLPREISLRGDPRHAPFFDFNPVASARLRYVNLHGAPRILERTLHDPGGDWIFPLPQNRITYPYPTFQHQRGTEGTPLMENNEGIAYGSGSSLEGRFAVEAYLGTLLSASLEPVAVLSSENLLLRVNKGYLKLGGGAAELEVGRDANWLGYGFRGALVLTDNARNLDEIKISSPEPVDWKHFWDFKYDLVLSRLDRTVTDGAERQPYFYAMKVAMKPLRDLEWGLSLGRQVGGPGVDNSMSAALNGLIGATDKDNSHTIAGMDLRLRFPWLLDGELYFEFAGSDRSDFWPMADSYVAGFFLPRLTASGRDDLRFEYFWGHQILYANNTFPAGYLYHGYPIGHSQGGATADYFLRYSHWFTARNNLALETFYTTRGDIGRLPLDAAGHFDLAGTPQALEKRLALRSLWRLPLYGDWDATVMYGLEHIRNVNLVPGTKRNNQLLRLELSYRY